MSLTVKFAKPWTYNEDADGNVKRTFPVGWVGEIADDLAAAAIIDQVVEPPSVIPPDVQHYIDMFERELAYHKLLNAMIADGASDAQIEAFIEQFNAAALTGDIDGGGDGGDADPGGEKDPPHDRGTGEVNDPPADPPTTKKKKAAG